MIDVGLFVPNENNNRCPQTGALLVFEGLLVTSGDVKDSNIYFFFWTLFIKGHRLYFYIVSAKTAINKYKHKFAFSFGQMNSKVSAVLLQISLNAL